MIPAAVLLEICMVGLCEVSCELLTQDTVGVKPLDEPVNRADMLVWLVILFCREKEGRAAGILPRAFSDIARDCPPFSSTVDAKEGLREV